MHHDELLLAATILIAASTLSVVIFRKAGFGSVLGLLATGIVVGPSGLAVTREVEQFRSVTELGVVLLLFVIGLEMDHRRLWAMRRAIFGMGLAQVAATGAVLAAGAMMLGHRFDAALIMGLGLALSSTAFVMQLLEERGEVLTTHGRGAFGILLLQDLMVVPLLLLVALLAGQPGPAQEAGEAGADLGTRLALAVAMLGLVVATGRWLLPRALAYAARQRNAEAFTGLALLAVVLAAWAMEVAGLSMALGAFLMGMLLARSRFHHQLEADVAPFKGVLLSLFFISVGMSIDVGLLRDHAGSIALVVCAIILVKASILALVARLFGHGRADALRLAALLGQGGEFGFVLFGAARALGLLDDATFVQTILVISTSMAATPLLVRAAQFAIGRWKLEDEPERTAVSDLKRHVIICGFGRVGRIVGAMLEATQMPYLAIERDPARLDDDRARQGPIIFGNASDRAILARAGIDRAAVVVVTLDDPKAVLKVVSAVRNFHAEVPVLARARDMRTRSAMLAQGVDEAVPEAVEMSLALGEAVLQRLEVADDTRAFLAGQLRADGFAALAALEMPEQH
ncbi:MAG: cation:proton antiporter [Geminicoccaceae bacterium]|nr:cation:proton antiporter [Geminicoccaceae bacterium]